MKRWIVKFWGVFIILIPVNNVFPQQSWNVDYKGGYHKYGQTTDVIVIGNCAYMVNGYGGLRIVDISDPSNPQEVGYYDTGGHAEGVYVCSSYAYVAEGGDGLYILQFISTTAIEEGASNLPQQFALYQKFPNPFNPTTTITYELSKAGVIELIIYNTLGKKVRTLVSGHLPADDRYQVH